MTPELVLAAIVEVFKAINFWNATLSPDEAKIQTARVARFLDFLFGWLDKLPPPTPSQLKTFIEHEHEHK